MINQSRFGYHPCNMEIYLKLKTLNKLYIDALHRKATWDRWYRKEPQNRIIRHKLRDDKHNIVGYGMTVVMNEPELNSLLKKDVNGVKFLDGAELIASEYAYARTPQSKPEDVRPLKISVETINRLLEK